jgi:DNA repair protein RecO (recombination protein O)
MQRCDEAFLLGIQELGDADLILTLLVEGAGTVRGVARSARRSRRRFGGSLEPMSRVRLHWFRKAGRDLHRIESMELVESYAAMQADPAVQAACSVVAEVTRTLCRENDDDPRIFRLVGAVLDALGQGIGPWVAVRYFEYWMLRLHGLLPDLASCRSCARDLRSEPACVTRSPDGLLCRTCARDAGAEARELTAAERRLLSGAAELPPEEMAGHGDGARAGGGLDWLLRGGLESFSEKTLRSYRHLGSMTAGGA